MLEVITVKSLIESRYLGLKNENWDKRISGIDIVLTDKDEKLSLNSLASQSPPQIGWKLVLDRTDFHWTLYGMA